MGKLLRDDDVLGVGGCGIVTSEKIVHLFPKPNVMVSSGPSSSSGGRGETDGNADNGDGGEDGRAHILQIVTDAS